MTTPRRTGASSLFNQSALNQSGIGSSRLFDRCVGSHGESGCAHTQHLQVVSNPMVLRVCARAQLTPEHPDPSGSLLAQLAVVLEWYVSERARLHQNHGEIKSFEAGVFIDFWSLYQGDRDEYENAMFFSALQSMDAWFGHAGTVTLLMTELPEDWGDVPDERKCTPQPRL